LNVAIPIARSQNLISPGIFIAALVGSFHPLNPVEEMPKGALGRIMAVLWMFVAVLFVTLILQL
jgi:hypothetical protein